MLRGRWGLGAAPPAPISLVVFTPDFGTALCTLISEAVFAPSALLFTCCDHAIVGTTLCTDPHMLDLPLLWSISDAAYTSGFAGGVPAHMLNVVCSSRPRIAPPACNIPEQCCQVQANM